MAVPQPLNPRCFSNANSAEQVFLEALAFLKSLVLLEHLVLREYLILLEFLALLAPPTLLQ